MFEFEELIQSAKIYIAAKDMNLKYLYCSENMAAGLDLESPSQIVGKTDRDLFEDSVADVYQSGDSCVLKGGYYLNVPEIQPHTTETLNIITTKNPLRKKSGELIGVVISFIDVTAVKDNLSGELIQYNSVTKRYEFSIGTQSEHFTSREYQIFKFILLGFPAKHIADELHLSPRTVESYTDTIKTKLQCTSKYQIAETAVRMGIVQRNLISGSVLFGPKIRQP